MSDSAVRWIRPRNVGSACLSAYVAPDTWVEREDVVLVDKELRRRFEEVADNYYGFGLESFARIMGPKFNPMVEFTTGYYNSARGSWKERKVRKMRWKAWQKIAG